MPVIQDLRDELDQVATLRMVTSTFEEIAAAKIVELRNEFEKNSLFYEEISQLYHSIKLSATIQKMKIKSPPVKPKTLHVAVTSNHHFYGTLNVDIVSRFYEETSKSPTTKVVIGSTGREYLTPLFAKSGATSFEAVSFERDTPTNQEIQSFLERFRDFDRIYVYFPKFISMLSQKVDIVDITHSPTDMFLPQSRRQVRYIFEPELPKIVEFFETQVRFLLFLRVMLETELSRTAGRLLAMNASSHRATDLMKEKTTQINQMLRSHINAQLIETFGRIKTWRKAF